MRDRIIRALEDLPQDATFEDAIERLVFLAKIEAGLAELNTGKDIPHDDRDRCADRERDGASLFCRARGPARVDSPI